MAVKGVPFIFVPAPYFTHFLTLVNTSCTYNKSPRQGGCIFADNNTIIEVHDSFIAYNNAGSAGGGISITERTTLTVVGTTITGNIVSGSLAGEGGGGISTTFRAT